MARRHGSALLAPTMPSGTEVGSYKTYMEASDAVDYLSDQGFDVQFITIVGTDLHMVERVTGKLTTGKVAASGAASGALWGAFIGLLMSFSLQSNMLPFMLLSLGGGALIGVIMSVLFYALTGSRRDFTSHSQTVASRYAVLAAAQIEEAYKLLQNTRGNLIQPIRQRRQRPEPTGPTEYGSRADEQPRFGVRLEEGQREQDQEQADEAPRNESVDPWAAPNKEGGDTAQQ